MGNNQNVQTKLTEGAKVSHDIFGEGVVINTSHTSSGDAAYIQFDKSMSYRNESSTRYRTILSRFLTSVETPELEV